LGGSAWRVLSDIGGALEKIWGRLTPKERGVVATGGLVALFIGAGTVPIVGPMIQAMMVLAALLALVQDFFAYIDGRKSSKTLAPIWGLMVKMLQEAARWASVAALSMGELNRIGIKGLWHGIDDKAHKDFLKQLEDVMKGPAPDGVNDKSGMGRPVKAGAYHDLISQYFGSDAATAEAITMLGEDASGDPRAKGKPNKDGTVDYGLFQINSSHIGELQKAGIIKSTEDLFNPEMNIAAAKYIYDKQGWGAWKSSRSHWGYAADVMEANGAGTYNFGSGKGTVTIEVGNITNNINGSNLSADQIAQKAMDGTMEALKRSNQRLQNEVGGIYH
jgi:hypothetical protein